MLFFETIKYLEESDDELMSVNDLVDKMSQCLDGTGVNAYSCKHMKNRLIDHFKDRIIICERIWA